MSHTVMVKATPLPNLSGRSDYISNPDRQENLVYTYEYTPDDFSFDEIVSAQSQHIAKQSKYLTKAQQSKNQKISEGREFMYALDNRLADSDLEELAKDICHQLEESTGQNSIKLGFHFNKTKQSFHVHAILPEYRYESQIKLGAVEKRNRYYDQNGKQSTKAKCTDSNGQLLPGCQLVKKGEQKKTVTAFDTKKLDLRDKKILIDQKKWLADYMNEKLGEDKYRWNKDPNKLTYQSVSKSLPEDAKQAVLAKNQLIKKYNDRVDQYQETLKSVQENDISVSKEDINYPKSVKKKISKIVSDVETPDFRSWEKQIALETANYDNKIQSLKDMIINKIKKITTRSVDKIKTVYESAYDKYIAVLSKNQQISAIQERLYSIQNTENTSIVDDILEQINSDIKGVNQWKFRDRSTYKAWARARVDDWNRELEKIGSPLKIADFRELKSKKNEIADIVNAQKNKTKEIYNQLLIDLSKLAVDRQSVDNERKELLQELKKLDKNLYVCAFKYHETAYNINITGMVDYDTAVIRKEKMLDYYKGQYDVSTGTRSYKSFWNEFYMDNSQKAKNQSDHHSRSHRVIEKDDHDLEI